MSEELKRAAAELRRFDRFAEAAAVERAAERIAELTDRLHQLQGELMAANASAEREQSFRFRAEEQLAAAQKDAAYWRMLPAFIEDYQINYVRLVRDIDAAMSK